METFHMLRTSVTDQWPHCLHLLRHVCRETSAVHSSPLTSPSVPAPPRSVAPRQQSNSEAGGGTAFRVARHTEGLPHVGTGLPSLPTLQSLPPHKYSTGRFQTTTSPFSSHPHRPRWTPSNVCRLHILPHFGNRFARWPEAISIPDITADTVASVLLTGLISLFLSGDHHHRPRTSVPLSGQIM
jgi:hypothetical protein